MVITESEAIPYEPNDLRGERLLVLAPHPDDEVIGCGGLIALSLREHRAVQVVVVTDGSEAGNATTREQESLKALGIVGGAPAEFLRYPDRQLEQHIGDVQANLRRIIDEFNPDLIAVPSPAEIHPDHVALSRAFCELVQNDGLVAADHAVARVAFYEVSAPIRPNALVDITAVADSKYAAVAAHESQLAFRDYPSYAKGLNTYRGMTLPPEVKFAEAYWVTPIKEIRTTPFSALRDAVAAPKTIEVTAEALPISVVIRTKNRPALLADAAASVRNSGYPADVVIVNDGGEKPSIEGAKVINNEKPAGRSEAMNAGVRAAKSEYIAFLDDDDLYYAEHLPTLANAARTSPAAVAWYSDAVSAFVRLGSQGTYETSSRMRIFGQDFDRDQLLLDNYIPLAALLVKRSTFLDLGGFDRAFDLFEDWDFLIRLAQRGEFIHVPRITCEIRHVEGAGSITLESPEGSERFRDAKLQVWRKHAELITNDVIVRVLERQKRRIADLYSESVEVRGQRDHVRIDVARIDREKAQLAKDIESLHARAAHLDGANAELRGAVAAANAERYEKEVRLKDLQAAFADVSSALEETQRTNGALYAEVARLQTLLDTIYGSRTWRLHNMLERLKGRG